MKEKARSVTVTTKDADAFKKIAEAVGLTPEQLQAITVKIVQDQRKAEQ